MRHDISNEKPIFEVLKHFGRHGNDLKKTDLYLGRDMQVGNFTTD